jgi:hypothetical protein
VLIYEKENEALNWLSVSYLRDYYIKKETKINVINPPDDENINFEELIFNKDINLVGVTNNLISKYKGDNSFKRFIERYSEFNFSRVNLPSFSPVNLYFLISNEIYTEKDYDIKTVNIFSLHQYQPNSKDSGIILP